MIPHEVNSIEAADCYIATVIQSDDFINRELGVHIPKLMPQVPTTLHEENSPTIKNSLNVKSNIVKDNISKVSYMKVKALDINTHMPTVGSKVIVTYIEGDPEAGFWSPFNVAGVDYEEDPDDKFEKEKLFTINFKYNDRNKNTGEYIKTVDIHKGDNITFEINGNISVGVGERNKDDRSNVNITLTVGD